MTPICYDLINEPSAITSYSDRIPFASLFKPAFSPPMQRLTLKILRFSWEIEVRAQDGRSVMVIEVFEQAYKSLWIQASSEEYYRLGMEDQNRVSEAYLQRCRRLRDPGACNEETRQGLRRIDFLWGHSKFKGLQRTHNKAEWILKLG